MTVWRLVGAPRPPAERAPLVLQLGRLLPDLRVAVRSFLERARERELRELRQAFGDPAAILRSDDLTAPLAIHVEQFLSEVIDAGIRADPKPTDEDVDEEAAHARYELARYLVNALDLYREQALEAKICETVFVVPGALLTAFETAVGGFLGDVRGSLHSSIALEPSTAHGLLRTLVDRVNENLPFDMPAMRIENNQARGRGGCCDDHEHAEPRSCPRCPRTVPDCAGLVSHVVIEHYLMALEGTMTTFRTETRLDRVVVIEGVGADSWGGFTNKPSVLLQLMTLPVSPATPQQSVGARLLLSEAEQIYADLGKAIAEARRL